MSHKEINELMRGTRFLRPDEPVPMDVVCRNTMLENGIYVQVVHTCGHNAWRKVGDRYVCWNCEETKA